MTLIVSKDQAIRCLPNVGRVKEGGREPPEPSTADAQLVRGQRCDFGRSRGGHEQQAETGDEKVVRLPQVTRRETRFAA